MVSPAAAGLTWWSPRRAEPIAQLADELERMSRRAVPHGLRGAMNSAAFAARTEWQRQMGERFVLRNTFTARSVRVVKASASRAPQAIVGSIQPYLLTQEEGGTKRKRGRHGVGIPTSVASGEGRNARPRRRLVRRPNRLANISLGARPGRHRKQRNAIAIRMAIASGRRFVFLELERAKGMFRIMGGKRRPRLEMIWDTSRPSVRIPRTPTLEPAMLRVNTRMPELLAEAMRFQLRRIQAKANGPANALERALGR
jgi:hypothetical protein